MAPSPISKEAAGALYLPTRDEQIVNTALLLFLRASEFGRYIDGFSKQSF